MFIHRLQCVLPCALLKVKQTRSLVCLQRPSITQSTWALNTEIRSWWEPRRNRNDREEFKKTDDLLTESEGVGDVAVAAEDVKRI